MSRVPSAVTASGVTELAAGAASGWIYTLVRTQPDIARQLGIKAGGRIRQWHLDLAMLGTATIAADLAVPDAPPVVRRALATGAWTNAMLFLPLAFRPEADKHPAFGAAAAASFTATTVGFVGMAVTAWRRRRGG